jgi:hypothetical protein
MGRQFRIAKLGTRPKGGSLQDNCEFKSQNPNSQFYGLRREPCALRLFFLATGYLSVNDFNGFNDLNDLNGCLLTP